MRRFLLEPSEAPSLEITADCCYYQVSKRTFQRAVAWIGEIWALGAELPRNPSWYILDDLDENLRLEVLEVQAIILNQSH